VDSTKAVLQKREAVLTSTDRTFKVEMGFMASMVGEGGQARPSLKQNCGPTHINNYV